MLVLLMMELLLDVSQCEGGEGGREGGSEREREIKERGKEDARKRRGEYTGRERWRE